MAGFGDLSGLRGDVDPLLTGIAVKLANLEENFIGSKLAPFVKVSAEEGTFLKYTAPSFLGNSSETFERAPGAPAERIDVGTDTGTYNCDEYSAEIPISTRDQAKLPWAAWTFRPTP